MTRALIVREVDNGFAVWDAQAVVGNPDAIAPLTYVPRWVFATTDGLAAFIAKHMAKSVAPSLKELAARLDDGNRKALHTMAELCKPGRISVGDPPPGAAYDAPRQQPTASGPITDPEFMAHTPQGGPLRDGA